MPNARIPLQNVLSTLSERVQEIAKRQETDSKRQEEDSKLIKSQLAENITKQYNIESKIVSVESMLMLHKQELDSKLANTKYVIDLKDKDDEITRLKAQNEDEITRLRAQRVAEVEAANKQTKTDVTIAGISVKTALLWAGLLGLLGLLGPLIFYAIKGIMKP